MRLRLRFMGRGRARGCERQASANGERQLVRKGPGKSPRQEPPIALAAPADPWMGRSSRALTLWWVVYT